MNNKVTEILIKAKEVIQNPTNWTQGTFARDDNGDPCDIGEATCFCALGAIHKIRLLLPSNSYADRMVPINATRLLEEAAVEYYPVTDVASLNDHYGQSLRERHEAVLNAFDIAIAKSKES